MAGAEFGKGLKDIKKPTDFYFEVPPKVGQVKHYPIIERVRYFAGLFPFNRDFILLLFSSLYIHLKPS